jgi:hypothetical protein
VKRALYLSVCAGLLFGMVLGAVLDANATSKPPEPKPSTSTSTSNANAGATAGAKAAAGATAAGGAAQASTGDASASNMLNVGGSTGDNYSSWAVALPFPAFTPPLPTLPVGSCLHTTQGSRQGGWNFAGAAEGEINPDKCILLTIYNAHVTSCRYSTAKQVLDLMTAKLLEGYVPFNQTLLDLSPTECVALNAVRNPAPVNYFLLPEDRPKRTGGSTRGAKAVVDPCTSPTARACAKTTK